MYKRSSQFLFNLRIISAITPIWVATSTQLCRHRWHVIPVETAAGSSKPQCCLIQPVCPVEPQRSQESGTEINVTWWSFHPSREDVFFFLVWWRWSRNVKQRLRGTSIGLPEELKRFSELCLQTRHSSFQVLHVVLQLQLELLEWGLERLLWNGVEAVPALGGLDRTSVVVRHAEVAHFIQPQIAFGDPAVARVRLLQRHVRLVHLCAVC